jgi:S-adenosylmethionine-diacylglycerol 3-amino-3-carboxypropyl transferase
VPSEIAEHAEFSVIRYAQCWEDADVLLDALAIKPGDVCLSIASGGDNSQAMLSRNPGRVVALDLSEAQLACLELRVAAYRELSHPELLEFVGSRPSRRRPELYRRCRIQLSPETRRFWDARSGDIERGIGGAGKFERYFMLFRRYLLPLVHGGGRVARLLKGGSVEERERFYGSEWDSWRWRALFRIFFSRLVMGRVGRDPTFFRYVEGSVAERILARARYALTRLDPSENPYLQWILTGRHLSALPHALRPENFTAIRDNLDRLEWQRRSVEDYLQEVGKDAVQRFNLSDIFEYMSLPGYHALLEQIATAGSAGARLVYWNMLVPRRRPEQMADRLHSLTRCSESLYARDKAFFYSDFVVEEIAS